MREFVYIFLVFLIPEIGLAQNPASKSIDSLIVEGKNVYYASPARALNLAREIERQSIAADYTSGRLEGLRLIGNSYYLMGRLDSATYYMLRLLNQAYEANHKGMQADVMIDIGQTYDKIGLHSLAFDYFQQAHDIRLEMGDPERLSVTYINLAYHYYLRDMLDTALHYYQKTEEILDTIPLTFTKPFLYNERGAVYLKQGKINKARGEINKAIELNEQMDNNWDLSFNYVMLADLEHQVGNNQLAEKHAYLALNISQKNNISLEYDQIYKILSEIKQSQGLPDQALEYLEKSYTYRDSLNLALTDQKILALDHYKRQKDNEIERLKLTNENLAQQAKILDQRYLLLSAVIVLIFAITVGFVLYHQKNRLMAAHKKIETQNKDLVQLNVTKNKLFSIITHDIRNPLSNINGMLQLARDGMISGDEFKQYAGSLVDQTDRISSLSNTLINWSRSQETGFSAEKELMSVDELITNSMEYLQFMADKKQIEINYDPTPDIKVTADPNMLMLVINNLLTNAIKFTPQNGKVWITVESSGADVTINVADTGIGAPMDLLDQLKDGSVHTQLGTQGEKGTGIGLLLSLDLMAFQNGQLAVKPNVNQGSIFSLTLPGSLEKNA